MTKLSTKWLGGIAGMAALGFSSVAHAASSAFPDAPAGTPVAGVVGLSLLAAGAVAMGLRHASRNK